MQCPAQRHQGHKQPVTPSGFTLLELLLAVLVGSMVVIVALATYRIVVRSRESALYHSQLLAQGRYTMNRIRDDLANFHRSRSIERMKFLGDRSAETDSDRLIMYVVSDRAVHDQANEADIYELEYYLRKDGGMGNDNHPDGRQGVRAGRRCLLRQCRPVLDQDSARKTGVSVRLAGDVTKLSFEYFDGRQWLKQWLQTDEFPKLVRVSMELYRPDDDYHAIFLSQVVALGPVPRYSEQSQQEKAGIGIEGVE